MSGTVGGTIWSSERSRQRRKYWWNGKSAVLLISHQVPANTSLSFRNRSSRESNYWKFTNPVRRNLLMAAVKRAIYEEWRPDEETYQNVAELRTLAYRRLTAAVVSSVQSRVRDMSIDSKSFLGQPHRFRTVSSAIPSPWILIRCPISDTTIRISTLICNYSESREQTFWIDKYKIWP